MRYLAFHLSFRPKVEGRFLPASNSRRDRGRGRRNYTSTIVRERGGGEGTAPVGGDGGNSFKSILHQFQPDYHPSSPLLRMSPKGGGWGALVTGKRKRGRRLEGGSQGWVHGSELPPSSLPNSRNGQQNLRRHDQGQKSESE